MLNMPSQGAFHRYPLDAFRFYPDAGIALQKWAQSNEIDLFLMESSTTPPEKDLWADFVAIFRGAETPKKFDVVGGKISGENWIIEYEIVISTLQELPYEMRKIIELEQKNAELSKTIKDLEIQIQNLKKSRNTDIKKYSRIYSSQLVNY